DWQITRRDWNPSRRHNQTDTTEKGPGDKFKRDQRRWKGATRSFRNTELGSPARPQRNMQRAIHASWNGQSRQFAIKRVDQARSQPLARGRVKTRRKTDAFVADRNRNCLVFRLNSHPDRATGAIWISILSCI